MVFFESILPSAIAIATVFLFGCTGEIIMEKAGHLNLGVPGVMCCGTFGGCLGVYIFLSGFSDPTTAPYILVVFMAILFSVIMSAFAGAIYALLTVTLKCNQNITGLALTTFGAGFTEFFMTILNKADTNNLIGKGSVIIRSKMPIGSTTGVFGTIFFNHGILVYLAIVVAIVAAILLKKSRIGLNLRAVGESPATADAAGINVSKYKWAAILSGSSIAGLGGLFYVLDFVNGSWENSSTIQSFGWMAVALVIFCVWKPSIAILGSIIFGIFFILPSYINVSNVVSKIFSMLPYVVTIVVLIVTSIVGKKSVQPPAGLGVSYFREER